jgi:PIN domain nuclease of toxin-antitoxin system
VLDASALISFLRQEEGHEAVAAALMAEPCLLSTVSRTEVMGKLVGSGLFTQTQVREAVALLGEALEVVPFDEEQSELAAYWYARRKPYGLSLGDCACLALAEARGLGLMTAEQAWKQLDGLGLGVRLRIIRPVV